MRRSFWRTGAPVRHSETFTARCGARCFVPRCDGFGLAGPDGRDRLWGSDCTAAPRSRTPSELRYSDRRFRTQTRKGTSIPYIAHPMTVLALVLEHGGDEDQAIAALLHDAAEDQGGVDTLEEIRKR